MKRVFGFIDCQADFIEPTGALYVPNAENIKENLGKLVQFAEARKCPIFFTQDQHAQTDPEMKTVGGPFPPHCIQDTAGAENIVEVATKNVPTFFAKRCYDVFDPKLGNAEIKTWLKDNKVTEVWLAGVATDYCVKAAALGLRREKIDVYIFESVIKGVATESTEKAIEEMKEAGCHFVTCAL